MSGADLAVLGAPPAFPDGIPYARPSSPALDRVMARVAPSYDEGRLTNGPLVRELEERVEARLGVRHAVAVASCTSGLMLAVQAVAPAGAVLVPSFTFSATAHAVAWNGLDLVFAECDPATFHLAVEDAADRLDGVGALIANHVFGTPCPAEAVERLAATVGARVVFDAASAFGAVRAGRPVGGFGDVEVFSLSPTKPVVAGEGGLVTTDDDDLAAHVRMGRDYGNPGDYDTRFIGLNARLSELHAAVALESLADLDEHHGARDELAQRARKALDDVPGIRTQHVDDGDRPTWKDLGLVVDPAAFGTDRDVLAAALRAEGVDTRRYFSPPVHRQEAYADHASTDLPITDALAASVLTLPVYPRLSIEQIDLVVELVARVHRRAPEVVARVAAVTSASGEV